MTITEQSPTHFSLVAVDLYRDIHKGIRAELFGLTLAAGSLDPSSRSERVALGARLDAAVDLLVSHAAHEDIHVQPAVETHLPELAEAVERDHLMLEARMVTLRDMAREAEAASTNAAFLTHRLYLELASFTGAYLEHQDVEERVIMPALDAAIGVDACAGIHRAIVGSIPPAEMASSLAVMLPAMNIDDRTGLLGGMRAGAPADVFEGVWGLASTVLTDSDHRALAVRLGIS